MANTPLQATEFENERQALRKIVGEFPSAGNYDLPLLKQNEEIFAGLKKWIAGLWEIFWTPTITGDQKGLIDALAQIILWLLKIGAVALICLAVGYLCVLAFGLLRTRQQLSTALFPQKETSFLRDEELKITLDKALASRNFRQALKLRWKLFLVRCKWPRHITPGEYFQSFAGELPANLNTNIQYAMMFGPEFCNEDLFEQYHRFLQSLEMNAVPE